MPQRRVKEVLRGECGTGVECVHEGQLAEYFFSHLAAECAGVACAPFRALARMAHLSVPSRTNVSRTDNGLSRGAVIGIAVGAGAGGTFLLVILVLVLLWWRGKGSGTYYSYDFGAAEPTGSVTGLRGTESTVALRGGPSQKSVLRMSLNSLAPRRDRGTRGTRRMPRADSMNSSTSATSEDGIAAPELSAPGMIGGCGVGYLDERGNPIIRRPSSFEFMEKREHSGNSGEL